MTLPLERHAYGEHDIVLPAGNQTRYDDAAIDRDTRLRMYRRLQEMRQFEKRAYDLFMQNLVKGTTHLSLGMEAVATGFGAAGDLGCIRRRFGERHDIQHAPPRAVVDE